MIAAARISAAQTIWNILPAVRTHNPPVVGSSPTRPTVRIPTPSVHLRAVKLSGTRPLLRRQHPGNGLIPRPRPLRYEVPEQQLHL